MYGRAKLISHLHETSQEVGRAFHTLGIKVRERFSRSPKPIDHLGGQNPEERLPWRVDHVRFNSPLYDENQEINIWPREGTTHEDMDVFIG